MTLSPELREAMEALLKVALTAITGYVGWSQRRNRKVGGRRDAVMDKLAAEVHASAKATESSLREFGAQLAALNQTSWAMKARVDVHETRIEHVEREVERLREKDS